MSHNPISLTSATELSSAIERACRRRDPSEVIRLMTKDAVWRDNDDVHVGRDEIWNALSEAWVHALHCATRQEIESCDSRGLVIRHESEWQHAIRGRWYRSSGEMRLSLDDHGRITTVESRRAHVPISVSERRLPISTVASAESVNSKGGQDHG